MGMEMGGHGVRPYGKYIIGGGGAANGWEWKCRGKSRICPLNGINNRPMDGNGNGRTGSARTENISLAEVVQRFKMLTTKKYIEGVRNQNWPKFNNRLWQRNYFERIIRNQKEYLAVRKYIRENPGRS